MVCGGLYHYYLVFIWVVHMSIAAVASHLCPSECVLISPWWRWELFPGLEAALQAGSRPCDRRRMAQQMTF